MARPTCPVCRKPLPDQKQARRLAYNGILVCDRTTCEEAANEFTRCTAGDCVHPAVAEGLCGSHNRQRLRQLARGERIALTPLRQRTGDRRGMLHVRVLDVTRSALGPAPSVRAREILESATSTGGHGVERSGKVPKKVVRGT